MNSILLIDDQSSVRKLLKKILERHDYKVHEAACSEEGLKQIDEQQIDLIILDVMLENEIGYQVCKNFKKNENISHIPIIFLTASEESTAMKEAYEAGGVDFILKPVDSGSLLMRVKSHFAQIDARRKLQTQHEELKSYQAILLQEEKTAAVSKMVGGLSHELNNPLACIKSNFNGLSKYLNRISEAVAAIPEEFEDFHKTCKKNLKNCLDIVEESNEEFLQLRSITDRLVTLDLPADEEQSYSLNEAIENSLTLYSKELSSCQLSLEKADDLPETICHPATVTEIISSLLCNSLYAVKNIDNANICISTQHDDQNIYLSIQDNGCGIPENILAKIWDPFFTTKDVGEGAGLGLSSVSHLIKSMNGSVQATSTVNEGATFTITLPLNNPK
ncbi:MAG: response regulator [Lentisphaeraceae bacterium]|nr:response regulator [Lentisphaeraceae bacterium]